MLSERAKEQIREQMSRYPVTRSALGHALYIAQDECGGWVPHEAIYDIAEVMGMEPADVQSMMSFYVMYNKAPTGKYLFEVCHNISCALLGAHRLFEVIERKCGIHAGETSEDGLFTVKGVECSAACGGAPAVQLNGLYYEKCTPEQLEQMIDDIRAGKIPSDSLYNSVYAPDLTPREGVA
jgi:NADH-quinone oxidoreductase subunit E